MSKILRNIIKIDEEKCNGCGLCIPSCKEGALKIVNGKARLVSEVYCDGLGACLGECPQGALSIEQEYAEVFDEKKVEEMQHHKEDLPCGCPGTMARTLTEPSNSKTQIPNSNVKQRSELRNWPVQLRLIPENAPYLKNARLLIMADCTAFVSANVHKDFISGSVLAIACPKLDDADFYIQRLTRMIEINKFRSIEVVMMEVPCCSGLSRIVDEAIKRSGVNVPKSETIICCEGEVLNN